MRTDPAPVMAKCAKIVIGANFGDKEKCLVTVFLLIKQAKIPLSVMERGRTKLSY